MKNLNSTTMLCYDRTKIIFVLAFFWLINSNAQNAQNGHLVPTIKSPNTATLGTYGETPVNLFTGTPNISIPIYNLISGNINVPISLSYHPSNVKPAMLPGWVGFGWSLNPGGAITRTFRGFPDEQYEKGLTVGNTNTYYPFPEESGLNDIDNPPGGDLLNRALNWNSKDFLGSLPSNKFDVLADEFNFNFLGYSGKFYYSGKDKGWEVVSDQNIKVEFMDEFIYRNEIIDIIEEYEPSNDVDGFIYFQPRFFGKFKITTPDGTQYEFGGHDGVELTSQYAQRDKFFVINSWVLTKITDINNNVVKFEYKRSNPTCQLAFGATSGGASFDGTSSGFMDLDTANFYGQTIGNLETSLDGYYNWGLYLTKISSSIIDIEFSSDRANSFTYTEQQLKNSNDQANSPTALWLIDNDINNLKGEKLNEIKIKNRYNLGGRSEEVHKFVYDPSPTQRLTLNSYYTEEGRVDEKKRYDFVYNDMDKYTPSCDGNYSDHWGYYNNENAAGRSLLEIYNIKKTSSNNDFSSRGLLTQITYPTRGYTNFIWESNDYSKVVNPKRDQLVNSNFLNGFTGGNRIAQTKSYDHTGTLITNKKYHYKKGFYQGAIMSGLESSGVLNAIPHYGYNYTRTTNFGDPSAASISHTSFHSLTNYGYTGKGSHVGYDEVVEEYMDGSYTKYFFTNYGTDLNGVSHFDHLPAYYTGYIPEEDPYMPHSLLEMERGKETGVFMYNSDNTLVQKTITTYRNDTARFNSYIRKIPSFVVEGNTSGFLLLATALKEYTYSYYPISKETTSYDLDGGSPVTVTNQYVYNSFNQVIEQKETTSDQKELKTLIKYPTNYTASPYAEMTAKNYISPVIEQTVKENEIQISKTITNYNENNGLYLPSSVQTQKNSNSTLVNAMNFQKYQKDKIVEYKALNGPENVLLWGYNKQYPIAKIENASYAEIATALGMTETELAAINEQDVETIESLRSLLPKAMITTYTHNPIFGVTSITDPRNYSMYYHYDDVGKLKYVKDDGGKILSYNQYNYKN
ncbi:hypothetical protein D1816_14305 [Aquimarina sp. AD10]|uniref:hypothetical protein n=1 Tax=Aquimarina sp. AD10 TaxID=1714849 RepID=UPI000E4B67E5|nr:hypothetical protein [Aquimarina sp. AD10]AXT61474.1 hypothetical protein D1816_14305 [Aquimarina sp. AD10]RKM89958.1 hypothetical protein D7033_24825 [Aquimarina sp. AD10]